MIQQISEILEKLVIFFVQSVNLACVTQRWKMQFVLSKHPKILVVEGFKWVTVPTPQYYRKRGVFTLVKQCQQQYLKNVGLFAISRKSFVSNFPYIDIRGQVLNRLSQVPVKVYFKLTVFILIDRIVIFKKYRPLMHLHKLVPCFFLLFQYF